MWTTNSKMIFTPLGKEFNKMWKEMMSKFEDKETLINIIDCGETYLAQVRCVGYEKDEISIKKERDSLLVKASCNRKRLALENDVVREFYFDKVDCKIVFPSAVDIKSVSAKLENGILYLRVRKIEDDGTSDSVTIE